MANNIVKNNSKNDKDFQTVLDKIFKLRKKKMELNSFQEGSRDASEIFKKFRNDFKKIIKLS